MHIPNYPDYNIEKAGEKTTAITYLRKEIEGKYYKFLFLQYYVYEENKQLTDSEIELLLFRRIARAVYQHQVEMAANFDKNGYQLDLDDDQRPEIERVQATYEGWHTFVYAEKEIEA